MLRRRHGGALHMRRAVLAGLLGPAAVGIGVAVVGPFSGGFGSGQTLDRCMQHGDTAKLQHLCKAQHLDEFMQRYPQSDE